MESSGVELERKVADARQAIVLVIESLTAALEERSSSANPERGDEQGTLPDLVLDIRNNIEELKTKVERAVLMSTIIKQESSADKDDDFTDLEVERERLRAEVHEKNIHFKTLIDHIRALRLDLVLTKDKTEK